MTPLAAALALTLAASSAPVTPAQTQAKPAGPAAPAGHDLPFVVDDYAAALADARARDVPLVVDAWAPW